VLNRFEFLGKIPVFIRLLTGELTVGAQRQASSTTEIHRPKAEPRDSKVKGRKKGKGTGGYG
jgi:hypothetical protein